MRLAGQFGDGVFQASLAGAVLFNPERQAHAADVAAGLRRPAAAVLARRPVRRRAARPLVAPAGAALANVARAAAVLVVAAEIGAGVDGVAFYAWALVIISISRFVLSALSASLPHVVAPANSSPPTRCRRPAARSPPRPAVALALGVRALLGDSTPRTR